MCMVMLLHPDLFSCYRDGRGLPKPLSMGDLAALMGETWP